MSGEGQICGSWTLWFGTSSITKTSIYKEVTDMMKTILGYSKTSKKFSSVQEEKLKQKLMDISKKIDDV